MYIEHSPYNNSYEQSTAKLPLPEGKSYGATAISKKAYRALFRLLAKSLITTLNSGTHLMLQYGFFAAVASYN